MVLLVATIIFCLIFLEEHPKHGNHIRYDFFILYYCLLLGVSEQEIKFYMIGLFISVNYCYNGLLACPLTWLFNA